MTEADADFIRSVLDRYVGRSGDAVLRVTFTNGEEFVLRYLSEVMPDRSAGTDRIGTWSGEVLAYENVAPEKEKFFRDGSGIDFVGSQILELTDETTGEHLFSRSSRRL